MIAISKKNKVGWIVAGFIYLFFLLLLAPFLIVNLVWEFDRSYDFYAIGLEGANTALSVSSVRTFDELFTVSLSTLASDTTNSLAIQKNTVELAAGNLTAELAASLGGYVPSLMSGALPTDTSEVVNTIYEFFTQPLVASFYPRLVDAHTNNNSTEKDLLEKELNAFFRTTLLSKFHNEEDFYARIAGQSAYYSLKGLFEAETYKQFFMFRGNIRDSPEASARLNAAFGKAVLFAYQTSSFDLAVIFSAPYITEINKQTDAIMLNSNLPLHIISLVLTVILASLCFWKRDEPEIKSKYHFFLVSIFVPLMLGNLTHATLDVLSLYFQTHENMREITAIFVTAFVAFYILFFCAINCRNWLMFNLFVLHKRESNFFLPLLWQLPVLLVVSIVIFLTYYTDMLRLRDAAIAMLVFFLLFTIENAFYIYKTRKAWSLFVDTHYNIRTLFAILFFTIPPLILLIAVYDTYQLSSSSGVFAFFFVYITLCYLFDSFLLPLLKIFFREHQISLLGSLSFEAQQRNEDDFFSLESLIEDKHLCALLLESAIACRCDENIRFFIALKALEKDVSVEKFKSINDDFIEEDSVYQLNLTSRTRQRALTGYERVRNHASNKISKDQIVFAYNLVEIEISRLIHENIMIDFKEIKEVQEIVQARVEQAKVAGRLASLGLVSSVGHENSSIPDKNESGVGLCMDELDDSLTIKV